MLRSSLLLVATLALAACAADVTSPRSGPEGLPEGLSVRLQVAPGEVAPMAPFTVRVDVTNTTAQTLQMVTSHGCLALPHLFRDGRRIPFRGSAWGCTAAITTHTFAPGETRTLAWEMRAELYAENPGDPDGAPAPRDSYRVRVEFDLAPPAGSGRKPAVEGTLRVR